MSTHTLSNLITAALFVAVILNERRLTAQALKAEIEKLRADFASAEQK